jgi:hypothetical protein
MLMQRNLRVAFLVALVAVLAFGLSRSAVADDLVHIVKGVVKSVDKGTKTMVVKTADGTEHAFKWTDKTATTTGKDVGDGVKEGTKVSVKYTEKAGEKTAVGVKDLGKDTAKGAEDAGKDTGKVLSK